MSTSESDERLIAYLLGELPESENVRIEEQYLASDASLALLMAIEAELYDAYASDSLSRGRRRLFERRFLATQDQHWQLEFSRTLLRVPRPKQHASLTRRWPRVTLIATVAAALLVAVVLWRSDRPLPDAQDAQQISAARAQVIIPLELGSGISREGGEEPTAELPSNSDLLRITAKTDQDLPSFYSAVLRKPEGTEVWKNDAIQQGVGGAKTAIVDIPVAPLSSGHYILTLYAPTQNGAFGEVADYAFRIQRP
jgi:hypothetical protein